MYAQKSEIETCFGWSGLLISYSVSIKAFSRWGLREMRRSIVVLFAGRLWCTQLPGGPSQECLTRISPKRDARFAARFERGTVARKKSRNQQ